MNEHTKVWSLQEAKARFSEVVRRAQSEGPQAITLHGKHAVTVYDAATEKLKEAEADVTGQAFVDAMQACPFKEEYPLVVPGERLEIDEPVDL